MLFHLLTSFAIDTPCKDIVVLSWCLSCILWMSSIRIDNCSIMKTISHETFLWDILCVIYMPRLISHKKSTWDIFIILFCSIHLAPPCRVTPVLSWLSLCFLSRHLISINYYSLVCWRNEEISHEESSWDIFYLGYLPYKISHEKFSWDMLLMSWK